MSQRYLELDPDALRLVSDVNTYAPPPIRVLHLRDAAWVDGPSRTILESAVRFDPRRIECHIGVFVGDSARPHPLVVAAEGRGVNVHCIRDRGGVDGGVISRLSKLILDLRIDILHTSDVRTN